MPIIGHSSTQTRCETTPRIKKDSKALSSALVIYSYLNLMNFRSLFLLSSTVRNII
jgi:hypothetical protein